MRPREIREVVPCLTGSLAESEAELISPELQPYTSNFTETETQEENHCQRAKCITGYTLILSALWSGSTSGVFLFVCVLPFPGDYFFSFSSLFAACESSQCRENCCLKEKEPGLNPQIKHFFSPFFNIKVAPDRALHKNLASFLLTFNCLFLHLIPARSLTITVPPYCSSSTPTSVCICSHLCFLLLENFCLWVVLNSPKSPCYHILGEEGGDEGQSTHQHLFSSVS